jgi:hypothetical protein
MAKTTKMKSAPPPTAEPPAPGEKHFEQAVGRAKRAKKSPEATVDVEGKAGVVYTFPATFGAMADKLYELRQERQRQQKQADLIEAEEKALQNHIINTMPKTDSGAAGKLAKIGLGSKAVPQVEDWDVFYKFVIKTKNFALLQKRLGEAMIKEIWDAGKTVPGVKSFTVVTVSLTKV